MFNTCGLEPFRLSGNNPFRGNDKSQVSQVSSVLSQGCHFGFFEAKFVIFWLFSSPLAFFIFEERPTEIWFFLAFFGELEVLRLFWLILCTDRYLDTN